MTNITVKNIPPALYEQIKQSAETNHRSINSEIISLIEGSLKNQTIDPDLLLIKAQRLREKTAHYLLTDEELNKMRSTGRL